LRTFIYSSTGRFLVRLVFVSVAVACVTSCNRGEEEPMEHVFTTDELYLIDSYVEVRRAGSHYPAKPLLADSLLTVLAAAVDSIRIEQTIATINLAPERWTHFFEEIERRLRESAEAPAEDSAEEPGTSAGEPADAGKEQSEEGRS